jgi:hypothetical protein
LGLSFVETERRSNHTVAMAIICIQEAKRKISDLKTISNISKLVSHNVVRADYRLNCNLFLEWRKLTESCITLINL